MTRLQSACFALCLAFAIPRIALADDKPKTADDWAEEAYALVGKGDYPKAIAAYQTAYSISADGRNLYNIANIYDRKLHERELAGDYYRRYLHLPQTEPDLVKKANERLAALKDEEDAIRKNGAAAPPPNQAAAAGQPQIVLVPMSRPTPAGADSTEATRSAMHTAGIVTGAAGLALIGAGAVLGLVAKSKNDDAAKLCAGSACNSQDALRLTDDAHRAATWSTIGFIAGGAAVAGGLCIFFLAPSDKRTGAIHVAPQIGPRIVAITLGGGWK